ncbi:unannotated protein [freshwater metagenome]|uniref:Unannotated protein n=1 Tax=freshwater metagenome TaxID=449393 RepID=A0A6J6SGD5_9ZZZZ
MIGVPRVAANVGSVATVVEVSARFVETSVVAIVVASTTVALSAVLFDELQAISDSKARVVIAPRRTWAIFITNARDESDLLEQP